MRFTEYNVVLLILVPLLIYNVNSQSNSKNQLGQPLKFAVIDK